MSAGLLSFQDVLAHSTREDCWVVFDGNVFDMSAFAGEHPGGGQLITVRLVAP